ncbi:hypothetical protein [Rhodococcus qingshengii]
MKRRPAKPRSEAQLLEVLERVARGGWFQTLRMTMLVLVYRCPGRFLGALAVLATAVLGFQWR